MKKAAPIEGTTEQQVNTEIVYLQEVVPIDESLSQQDEFHLRFQTS